MSDLVLATCTCSYVDIHVPVDRSMSQSPVPAHVSDCHLRGIKPIDLGFSACACAHVCCNNNEPVKGL